jgi:tryptophan-rich sensory protein
MQQQQEIQEAEAGEIAKPLPITRSYCTAQIFASLTVFTYATFRVGVAWRHMERPSDLLFPLLWFLILAPVGFVGAIQWRQTRRRLALSETVTLFPASAFFAATVFAILGGLGSYVYYIVQGHFMPMSSFIGHLFFYSLYLGSVYFRFKHALEILKREN